MIITQSKDVIKYVITVDVITLRHLLREYAVIPYIELKSYAHNCKL